MAPEKSTTPPASLRPLLIRGGDICKPRAASDARTRPILLRRIKKNVTIDWTVRDNVRAQLRVLVKRILRKYGYPPDKQAKATQTVLEQAALLSQEWAVA